MKDFLGKKKSGDLLQTQNEKETHVQDYRRRMLSEFFKKIPTQKCDNCQGSAFSSHLNNTGGKSQVVLF